MPNDKYDLRQIGLVHYDSTPRRQHTPEETARLLRWCDDHDQRLATETAAFEARGPLYVWTEPETTRPVFARRRSRRRLTLGVILGLAVWTVALAGATLWIMALANGALDAVLAR